MGLTIYDIAREAGVSASTVSRVINSRPGIRKSTRERVERILRESNFSVSEAARGLVNQTSRMIGILVSDIRNKHHIEGAYMSAAANWLFAAKYDAMMSQQIGLLENTGLYTTDQLDLMARWLRSPLWLIFGSMVGSAIKGGFFGLFIAAYTRREPQPFPASDDSHDSHAAADHDNDANA